MKGNPAGADKLKEKSNNLLLHVFTLRTKMEKITLLLSQYAIWVNSSSYLLMSLSCKPKFGHNTNDFYLPTLAYL